MIDIQPQFLTFGRLLTGRLFRIPPYQRAYSWRQHQREDLFEDIIRTRDMGGDASHFLATIVGLRREKRRIITDEHQVIEIVDGQQRLTTLIILMKAIAKAVDRRDSVGAKIGLDLDEVLVKPDQLSLLLLQTNHDSSGYFADYLRKGSYPSPDSATTLADRELLSAMRECEKFVSKWAGPASDLVALIKNRLTCILHEISDEAAVYTVFEVLNSRGLEVSWFDRLKSMLMAIIFEANTGNRDEIIEEVHRLWTSIYSCVGIRLGMSTESLRFAATLRLDHMPNRPLGEEDAAYLLRDQSKGSPVKVIETTKWLQAVTLSVDALQADRRRNAVSAIAQARLVAVAVNMRSDFSEDERSKVLRRWENVTFRIYGMAGKDARWAVGNYVRLAWRIVRKQLPSGEIMKELSEIGKDFPIDDALQNLEEADCYTYWQEEVRYFLCRYEEHLAHEAGQKFNNEQWNRIWLASAADSVEHIMPQSAGSAELANRLGNLLVLPPKLNSKLGAKAPKDKAAEYGKTGLLIAGEVVDQISKAGWGPAAIKDREAALLEWAHAEWED